MLNTSVSKYCAKIKKKLDLENITENITPRTTGGRKINKTANVEQQKMRLNKIEI